MDICGIYGPCVGRYKGTDVFLRGCVRALCVSADWSLSVLRVFSGSDSGEFILFYFIFPPIFRRLRFTFTYCHRGFISCHRCTFPRANLGAVFPNLAGATRYRLVQGKKKREDISFYLGGLLDYLSLLSYNLGRTFSCSPAVICGAREDE